MVIFVIYPLYMVIYLLKIGDLPITSMVMFPSVM